MANNDFKKTIEELKKVNEKARALIEENYKKIAELDLKYTIELIKNDIDYLKKSKESKSNQ